MTRKCLFISGVPSPFQVELAESTFSHHSKIEMDVWFCARLPNHRGVHWLSAVTSPCSFFLHSPGDGPNVTLSELLQAKAYDIIICGLPFHSKTLSTLRPVLALGVPIVMWNEQPTPRNYLLSLIKKIVYKNVLKKIKPATIFAIGDRAVTQYRMIYNGRIHLVPYFQKLPSLTGGKGESSITGGKIRFIFSGRLIKRNNIKNILDASSILVAQGFGNSFEVVFFGDGALKKNVKKKSQLLPDNVKISHFSPDSWQDRVSPLSKNDVLLCPACHSGWGLTIPEALSLGMPVISTSHVESARYFIKDGLNGISCGKSGDSIASAMRFFIKNPSNINEMAQQCIESSAYGDVKYGRLVFSRLLVDILSVNEDLH